MTEKDIVISVVAENLPFLKRGALADFKNIMISSGMWNERNFHKTDNIYTFITASKIEFFSVENYGRALGAARDYLFINECNNIAYETAFQLIARTRKQIYLDFNPVDSFWVHKEIMGNDEFKGDWEFIQTTFLGNEMLEESIKKTMLARAAKDENYRRVYVLGEIGKQEGLIFKDYKLIESIPDEIILNCQQYFGVDWGWSNDPSTICNVYIVSNDEQRVADVYVDELFYNNKTHNRDIAKLIKKSIERVDYEVVADSSEPKSIDELENYGINIFPADKPAGSVNYGIELMQQANIYITKNSLNTIKEFRNYKWSVDRNGEVKKDSRGKPVPIDNWNHCFTYNTKINTIDGYKMIGDLRAGDLVLTQQGYKVVNSQWCSGIKDIYEYNLIFDTLGYDICIIKCTNNHKFKINNKWKEIKEIKKQDVIIQNKSLMVDGTTYTQVKDIIQKVETIYTEKYGNTIMEKFQKVITFIMLMVILQIIKLKTCNLLKVVNTCLNTVKNGTKKIKNNLMHIWKVLDISQKSGINQKKVKELNQKEVKRGGQPTQILEKLFATVVKSYLKKIVQVKKDFVQTNVNQNTEEIMDLMMFNENVNIVVNYLPSTNILKLDIAQKRVVLDVLINKLEPELVYDIEVEQAHHFYANDVLVHNCIDGIRYVCLHHMNKTFEYVDVDRNQYRDNMGWQAV